MQAQHNTKKKTWYSPKTFGNMGCFVKTNKSKSQISRQNSQSLSCIVHCIKKNAKRYKQISKIQKNDKVIKMAIVQTQSRRHRQKDYRSGN